MPRRGTPDDPLSDERLDQMHNTGTTWGRYRNRL